MKRWALIVSGVVSSVVTQDNRPTVDGLWVECTGQVGPRWTWDGANFARPPEPPPATAKLRAARLALIAVGKELKGPLDLTPQQVESLFVDPNSLN